jgi:uncharacterized membrane protein YbaN (DUF454 family)
MLNLDPNPIARAFFLFIGVVSLVLGIVGIFIPLLPTTPFLLLSSYSFARSNERFNNWLLTNRFFGNHLQDYIARKTVKRQIKWFTIGVLWITIVLSVILIGASALVKGLLITVAIGVTVHLVMLKGSK